MAGANPVAVWGSLRRRGTVLWLLLLLLHLHLVVATMAYASGPRWVSGPPYFTARYGQAIGWKQPRLLYFTDPGGLGPAVDHAAADALVAAAAGVWNLPVASITVARGGTLAEHVDGNNVYLDAGGMTFPADVLSANASAIPIAVVYDTDGSVTDTLLGASASDPVECRQNAVTESVDSFDPGGYILHAVIVVNGRCSGPAPQMQMELQYQLMRVFGRVLGLSWSQTNDNVFTGSPTPTYNQALHWPILHPVDILCGPYAFQCLPDPFTLRPDDIASLIAVYPNGENSTPAAGKVKSLAAAHMAQGTVSFPTGQGMAGVNVVVQRQANGQASPEHWFEASAVTGAYFKSNATSPFVASPAGPYGSFGSGDQSVQGRYRIDYIPIAAIGAWQNVVTSLEPINPLYTGAYALGPYVVGEVLPAGSLPAPQEAFVNGPYSSDQVDFVLADAPSTCGTGQDGTAAAPAQVPATGWWKGLLCGFGHVSYLSTNVRPGRSFTFEVTALDEQGRATESKAMPVLAAFSPTDAPMGTPSIGVTPGAFQANTFGTTSLRGQTGLWTAIRFGVADQRGDGRPDYAYQARLFYADTVTPALTAAAGGAITLTGTGFRYGNSVTINGVAATVLGWTSTSIVLTAPTMALAKAADNVPVDIVVSDRGTGASSTMMAAFTYVSTAALPNILKLVSGPTGSVYVGSGTSTPFSLQLLQPDGHIPIAGQPITLSATSGSVQYAACGKTSCTLISDASGMVASAVTPLAAGAITLQAVAGAVLQNTSFTAIEQPGRFIALVTPSGSVPTGQEVQPPFIVRTLTSDNAPLPNQSVLFTVLAGAATFNGCVASSCTLSTDSSGVARIFITPTAPGPLTVQAASGGQKLTAMLTAVDNSDVMRTIIAPSGTAWVGEFAGYFKVSLTQRGTGEPDAGQTVTFQAPAGVLLNPCGASVCSIITSSYGQANVSIVAQHAGTFTITATCGSETQTVTATASEHVLTFVIVSAPSGTVPVGVTSPVPFTVQALEDGTTPVAGLSVGISGPADAVQMGAVRNAAGRLDTDGNGMVSTSITPLRPGLITLNASYAPWNVTASFVAVGVGQTMKIVQQPGPAGVFVGDSVPLGVEVSAPGRLAPDTGRVVSFTVTGGTFAFTDCPYAACNRATDGSGQAAEVGVVLQPGLVTLVASTGQSSQTFRFIATTRPDVMRVVSAPSSGATVGSSAPTPFAVQLHFADNVTLAPNHAISLSVTSGSAGFAACGGAPQCVLQTDAAGMVSSAVTPLSGGAITLSAAEGSVVQTATFSTVDNVLPNLVTLASVPAPSLLVGAKASALFAVQVTRADGMTPVPGVSIALSLGSQSTGTAWFDICGSINCTFATGANGMVSTGVTAIASGSVTLQGTASLATGAQTVASSLQVLNQFNLASSTAPIYLFAGASVDLYLTVNASQNGLPATGQVIRWTSPGGFQIAPVTTSTDASGASSAQVLLGPLTAEARASANACAWATVCTGFEAFGVAASNLSIGIRSGGAQSVAGSVQPVLVVAQVVDLAGHPVASAPVSIYQTVTALAQDCPAHGRCPAAPILDSRVTVATTSLDGTLSLVPLTVAGVAARTEIALSAGTQGFTTTDITTQP